MYNPHRGMAPPAPSQRFTDLLDQVRAEYDTQAGRAHDFENQIAQQLSEIDLIRRKIYDLEQAQSSIKLKYEEEIARLHRELDARGGAPGSTHGPSLQHPQPPPPSIGLGPSNLFGGIMAGGANSGGGPALAPPHQEQAQSQAMPHHMSQGGPGLNPGPAPIQHGPFGNYQQHPPAGVNGYGAQGPQPAASPGPGKSRQNRGHPGPATPQQNQIVPYPGSPQGLNVGNNLADLVPDDVPADFKRESNDWFAIFNPRARRVLDVNLVHTLQHESVVCCVRFSHDGHYIATGCNRSAQIFDVGSGKLVAHLQDNSLPDDGDLYIRSVCFSPDGKYLATGAEDKIIRVWDITSGTIRHHFAGHDQDIYSLDFARNGRMIASGSGDKTVRLWDLAANQQVMQLNIEDGVTTVAISPDNSLVAAGSLDKSVRVWDTSNGALLERLEGDNGHKDSVYSVAFSPNGRDIVSGSLDKTIKMWELTNIRTASGVGPKSAKCTRTFEGHKDFVLSVALTPDGGWVLSGSKDRGVQFWDPATGIAQLMLQGHKNSVISVAPSPIGGLFATGSGDMRARIWSYEPYRG